MSERDEDHCDECGATLTPYEKSLATMGGEYSGLCGVCVAQEGDDFLSGVTCNPDAPEECESCQ